MLVSLGPHRFDVTHRALVMGILNRTPDSFYDRGSYYDFDAFLRQADQLVADGADFLDVGGVKAGPGDEVTEAEELERVVPAIEALRARFDLPLSVDTWRASVAEASLRRRSGRGQRHQRLRRSRLPDRVRRAPSASVVATHIRLAPARARSRAGLRRRRRHGRARSWPTGPPRAERRASPRERIMVDAGLDLGKTEPQSVVLLRHSDRLAALGYPVLLSASNKRFLWRLLDVRRRRRRRRHDGRSRARGGAGVSGPALPRCPGGAPGRGRHGRRARGELTVDLDTTLPIHLVKGDDAVLVGDVVRELVDQAVGGGDRSLAVTELDATAYEDDQGSYSIGPLVDAAQTPPFLTDRRVVVGRHASVFSTGESVEPLVRYLADPLPTTVLVLVWEKGPKSGARVAAVPRKLADAVTRAGGAVIDTKPGTGKRRTEWLDEHLADRDRAARRGGAGPARSSTSARRSAGSPILLDTFESVFGPGAKLTAADIEPYLGDAGDVAPWDLTDAIDRGDTQEALGVLGRMLGAGRHPLQVTASLHGHYQRMLRLDGSGVTNEAQAAEVLGMKGSTFPARKALDQARALGPDRIQRVRRPAGRRRPRPARGQGVAARAGGRGAGGAAGQPQPADPHLTAPLIGSSRISERSGQGQEAAAATRLARRDLRRAAWFLWMTPLLAALSRRLMARRVSSSAFSAPSSAAVVAALVRVFSSERTALLRTRRFSFCLLRLIWLLMLATR